MEGTDSNKGVAEAFDLSKLDKRKGSGRLLKVGIIALVVVLVGAGYFLYSYLKPMYVIDGVSITRQDIANYKQGLEDYKKEHPKVDFGKDLKKVATDDLVLNASYKAEMKKRKDTSQDAIIKVLDKQTRYGSEGSKTMQRVRAENNTYQKHLTPLILAQRDLTFINISFDAPYYDGKSPEQVKALRQQSIDTLNKTFMPLVSTNASKEQIASKADVNYLDADRTDDQNYQQYFDGLVSSVDYRTDFIVGASALNDLDNTEYYGVKVDNLKDTTQEISKLTRNGQHTPVFASKTGNYTIIRLEKIHGGSYKNWDDFLAQYKKNNAKSKLFAYDLSPSKAFDALANTAIINLTNPGLQHAQAASCSSHGVAFVIKSYDLTAFVEMPGATVVNQYRKAHNCDNAFEGNRSSGTLILDNCLGPAPTWSVLSYADQNKYYPPSITTAEGITTGYSGWPIWSTGTINNVGTIYINFYYVQKPDNDKPTPQKGDNLDVATCDKIAGWVYDSTIAGGITKPVEVHAYFDQPLGVAGTFGYPSGPADKSRTDVGAAFAGYGVGDNHGYDFNPSNIPGYNIRDGRDHTVWLYAANIPGGNYELTHRTIPACGPHPPSISVDANSNCDYFNFSASDPDNQTSTFTYEINLSNPGGNSASTTVGPVVGGQSLNPWPLAGIDLTYSTPQGNGIDWSVKATKVGGNGLSNVVAGNLPRCPFNQNKVTIKEQKPTLYRDTTPDEENPNNVTFNASFELPIGRGMKDVQVSCKYYIRPLVGADRDLGSENDKQYLNSSYLCTKNVALSNLTAGDRVCADYVAAPGEARTDQTTDVITRIIQATTLPNPKHICAAVKNKPFVSFYGNDVFAGGGYGSTCNAVSRIRAFTNNGVSGSGVQFAASALGEVSGFNSARLRTGAQKPLPPDGLTFANIGATDGQNGIGQHCLFDYYSHRDDDTVAQDKPDAVITSLAKGKWKHSGSVTIGNGTSPVSIGLGNKASLYVDGDVTINSNVEYAPDSGWLTLNDIPSFYLIVKGNIYVSPNVTRLDGMYIMQPNTGTPTGAMFTCAAATPTHQFTPLDRYNNCKNRLTINGGLQAVRVYFDRIGTYSLRDATNSTEAKAGSSTGAEIVNFSPEMYLTSPNIPRESRSGGTDNQNLEVLPPVL